MVWKSKLEWVSFTKTAGLHSNTVKSDKHRDKKGGIFCVCLSWAVNHSMFLENQMRLSRQKSSCNKQVLWDIMQSKPWRLQTHILYATNTWCANYLLCADAFEVSQWSLERAVTRFHVVAVYLGSWLNSFSFTLSPCNINEWPVLYVHKLVM